MKIPLKHEQATAARRSVILNKIAFILAVIWYVFMSATVALAWFTPELELSLLRLSIASVLLIPGWYYLLSKTAAKRDWEYVKAQLVWWD